jgi:hypothetical protein
MRKNPVSARDRGSFATGKSTQDAEVRETRQGVDARHDKKGLHGET